MAFKKLKELLNGDEINDYKDDDYYELNEADLTESGKLGSKMILIEPRANSESQQIADHLKNRNSVVVNLRRVTSEQAKRIIDFLSGCVYAIGGELQKIGNGIYLCTPKNVNVQGKINVDEDGKDKSIEDELDL